MLKELLLKVKSVPVCVFEDIDSALKVAEILLDHNVGVIEVTLRTEKAFDCISAIKKEFNGAAVGAGSVLNSGDFARARDNGAVFAVSPSFDEELCRAASGINLPYIPGVATPSELYRAMKFSNLIKIFPASALGGVDYINAIAAPFRMFDFGLIPTGGIDNKNFTDYLKADRVIACGLTYPVNEKLIKEKNFDAIKERVTEIYGAPL